MDSELPCRAQTQASDSAKRERNEAWLALLGASILQLPIWGIAMTFGIFQEVYAHSDLISGAGSASGVVGTTMNGVMYLSMPILFIVLDRGLWAGYRRATAIAGAVISCLGFLASSFSTQLWHLILLQGVLAALGNAMIYSPTTLDLDDHFTTGRATAYGAVYSSKNIVGSILPIVLSRLLQGLGFRWTLRIWAAIVLCSGALGIAVISVKPTVARRPQRSVPWAFLRHKTFYIYTIANMIFSSGYGIPQTYLSSYARDVLRFTDLSGSVMITLFNAPGIISCVGFGLLSDKLKMSSTTITCISAMGSCMCALIFWGLASSRGSTMLVLFAVSYGFFSGGYSSTWGGWIKDLEREAAEANEAIHTGMLVGLFNGARGVGYILSGITGVELLNAGAVQTSPQWGYGTKYGGLILFTGLSSAVGCWNVAWKGLSRVRRCCLRPE